MVNENQPDMGLPMTDVDAPVLPPSNGSQPPEGEKGKSKTQLLREFYSANPTANTSDGINHLKNMGIELPRNTSLPAQARSSLKKQGLVAPRLNSSGDRRGMTRRPDHGSLKVKAIAWLQMHPNATMGEAAKALGMSPTYLGRIRESIKTGKPVDYGYVPVGKRTPRWANAGPLKKDRVAAFLQENPNPTPREIEEAGFQLGYFRQVQKKIQGRESIPRHPESYQHGSETTTLVKKPAPALVATEPEPAPMHYCPNCGFHLEVMNTALRLTAKLIGKRE